MRSFINNIGIYFKHHKSYVEIFFIIFYLVGFFGLANPLSRQLFDKLFPLALFLSFIAILLFHNNFFDNKTIVVLSIIGLSSYFIEVVGVNTHLFFGNYTYGKALGIKMFNTPLFIGVNWVMLSYASSSITEDIPFSVTLKIIIASFLMLVYDIILEQIAPVLDMWHWDSGVVPIRNYFSWFVIACIFQTFIKIMGINTRNSIVLIIILIQIVFFISLIIFL